MILIFTRLTLGNGSSMAQIVEGEFELREMPCSDGERTVPMFVGVRGKRVWDDDGGKHRRESVIAIPVGAVTMCEFREDDPPEDEPVLS